MPTGLDRKHHLATPEITKDMNFILGSCSKFYCSAQFHWVAQWKQGSKSQTMPEFQNLTGMILFFIVLGFNIGGEGELEGNDEEF